MLPGWPIAKPTSRNIRSCRYLWCMAVWRDELQLRAPPFCVAWYPIAIPKVGKFSLPVRQSIFSRVPCGTLRSLNTNLNHGQDTRANRTRHTTSSSVHTHNPPPALRPAPPPRSNTSTEYSLPGATQLSQCEVFLSLPATVDFCVSCFKLASCEKVS